MSGPNGLARMILGIVFSTSRPPASADDPPRLRDIRLSRSVYEPLGQHVQRVVRVLQKIAPGGYDTRALLQRLHHPALLAHHADQLLGVGRQAVALHANGVEGGVEAECFAGEAGARDGGGGAGQTVAVVEGEARLRQRGAFGNQPQRDLALDSQARRYPHRNSPTMSGP